MGKMVHNYTLHVVARNGGEHQKLLPREGDVSMVNCNYCIIILNIPMLCQARYNGLTDCYGSLTSSFNQYQKLHNIGCIDQISLISRKLAGARGITQNSTPTLRL